MKSTTQNIAFYAFLVSSHSIPHLCIQGFFSQIKKQKFLKSCLSWHVGPFTRDQRSLWHKNKCASEGVWYFRTVWQLWYYMLQPNFQFCKRDTTFLYKVRITVKEFIFSNIHFYQLSMHCSCSAIFFKKRRWQFILIFNVFFCLFFEQNKWNSLIRVKKSLVQVNRSNQPQKKFLQCFSNQALFD